ncbi:MAG: alcohol dehydrogenase catalytic domain-containing protein, partial [Eubacteriales bacterium]
MKALVKYDQGYGKMEIRDVPVPTLKECDVLIKVKAVGVCGTDLKIYDGHFPCNTPVVVGHEFAGIVEQMGQDVAGWNIGDCVVSEQHTCACGRCRFCLTGQRHLCAYKKAPGYGVDGAYAEYIAIPAHLLHKIPEGVTLLEGALLEPMAISACGVLGKAKIFPQDFVVILGCGPIALLTLQMVRAAGASKVYMTGLDA